MSERRRWGELESNQRPHPCQEREQAQAGYRPRQTPCSHCFPVYPGVRGRSSPHPQGGSQAQMATKRANGEGTIHHERERGQWVGRLYVGGAAQGHGAHEGRPARRHGRAAPRVGHRRGRCGRENDLVLVTERSSSSLPMRHGSPRSGNARATDAPMIDVFGSLAWDGCGRPLDGCCG